MKKHVLCLGDSNTHGYCADPTDCADGGIRFNEEERWTCRLQTALGSGYLVTEEGLSGRTTVFADPIHESMDALSVAYALLKSHEVIDLLIIMLGTNDVKERFGANAACIAAGLERLILKCKSVDCWGAKAPNILVVAPPRIKEGFHDPVMGEGCVEKSAGVAEQFRVIAERQGVLSGRRGLRVQSDRLYAPDPPWPRSAGGKAGRAGADFIVKFSSSPEALPLGGLAR